MFKFVERFFEMIRGKNFKPTRTIVVQSRLSISANVLGYFYHETKLETVSWNRRAPKLGKIVVVIAFEVEKFPHHLERPVISVFSEFLLVFR